MNKTKEKTCPQLGKGGTCTKEMREKYSCPFIDKDVDHGESENMNTLELWTIYKHPKDYPDKFVAVKFILDKPTSEIVIGGNINEARLAIPKGLTRFLPDAEDAPEIVEVWL